MQVIHLPIRILTVVSDRFLILEVARNAVLLLACPAIKTFLCFNSILFELPPLLFPVLLFPTFNNVRWSSLPCMSYSLKRKKEEPTLNFPSFGLIFQSKVVQNVFNDMCYGWPTDYQNILNSSCINNITSSLFFILIYKTGALCRMI